jgi:hypothetical protein
MLRMFCLTHQRPTPQVRWRRICPHDTRSCSQSSWTLRAAASSTRRSIFWDGCPEILPLTTDLKSYTTELFASQVAQGTPPVNQNKDRSVPFRSLITKGYRVILSLNVLEFAERGSTMRDQWSLNFFWGRVIQMFQPWRIWNERADVKRNFFFCAGVSNETCWCRWWERRKNKRDEPVQIPARSS